MELTYRGDWLERSPHSSTLRVGDYHAHVYQDRPNWAWRVRWETPNGCAYKCEFEEIAHHNADDAPSARTAAEAAIREHHTQRFA